MYVCITLNKTFLNLYSSFVYAIVTNATELRIDYSVFAFTKNVFDAHDVPLSLNQYVCRSFENNSLVKKYRFQSEQNQFSINMIASHSISIVFRPFCDFLFLFTVCITHESPLLLDHSFIVHTTNRV